jgi:hypothetical protein
MPDVQVAIEMVAEGAIRCFYISADDRERAERLLRQAFRDVGQNVEWVWPLK